MKKTALVISIAVTVLVLIALGGIFTSVQNNAQAAAQSNDKAASKLSDPNLDPSIQQLINNREQSYQNLINQANQRIDQLQKENQQLRDQLNALQSSSSNNQNAAGLSPDQAAQVAANYLGETDLYSLESGMFNGIPVYKVTFSSGNIVLVGADGQIVAQQIVSNNNNSGSSRLFGEHEGNEGQGGDD